MARADKLVEKFKKCTGRFPHKDLLKVLAHFGYDQVDKGDGSRRRVVNPHTKQFVRFHEPHPGNEAKEYVVRQVKAHLEEMGLL